MTLRDLQGIAGQIAPGATIRDPGAFARFLEEEAERYRTVSAQQPALAQPGASLAPQAAPMPQDAGLPGPQGFPLARVRDASLGALGAGGQLLASLATRAGVGPDAARQVIDERIAAGENPDASAFQRFVNQVGGGFFGFDEARSAFPQVNIPNAVLAPFVGPQGLSGGSPLDTAFSIGGAEALETVLDPLNAFDVGPIARAAPRIATGLADEAVQAGRGALRAGERAAQAVGEANVGNVLLPAAPQPQTAGMAASEFTNDQRTVLAWLAEQPEGAAAFPTYVSKGGIRPQASEQTIDALNVLEPRGLVEITNTGAVRITDAGRGVVSGFGRSSPPASSVSQLPPATPAAQPPVAAAEPPPAVAGPRAFRTELTPEEIAEVNAEQAQRAGMDAQSFAALTPQEQADVLADAGRRRPPPQQPPAGAGGTVPPGDPTQGVVDRLVAGIKSAKPVREETEATKSAVLRRRVAGAAREFEGGDPLTASQRSNRFLGGELPTAQFEPQRDAFTPDDLRLLYGKIQTSKLRFFDRKNTADALTKLLAGEVPQREEIAHLERMFGPKLAREILKKRPLGKRVLENTVDALNIPKTLLSSVDLSAPFRQGIVLAPGHPKEFFGNFGTMIRAFASEKTAQEVNAAIRADPLFPTLVGETGQQLPGAGRQRRQRLFMGDIGQSGTLGLNSREESFMSRLAEHIPIGGRLVRGSNRAYTTYLNKLRFDVAKTIYEGWVRGGDIEITPSRIDLMTRFINRATGRGGLGPFEGAANVLNAAFWSPRFVVSRPLTLASLATKDPVIAKMVARDLLAFTGTGLTVLGLIKLSGMADVEHDPRSSDFGKIRVGNTRYDFWGGFQPIARYTAQAISKQSKVLKSGEIRPVDGWETLTRFVRSKLAPGVPTLIGNELAGKTFPGDELGAQRESLAPVANIGPERSVRENEIIRQFIPLVVQEILEAVDEEGVIGAFKTAPAIFGVGSQTFDESEPRLRAEAR